MGHDPSGRSRAASQPAWFSDPEARERAARGEVLELTWDGTGIVEHSVLDGGTRLTTIRKLGFDHARRERRTRSARPRRHARARRRTSRPRARRTGTARDDGDPGPGDDDAPHGRDAGGAS